MELKNVSGDLHSSGVAARG